MTTHSRLSRSRGRSLRAALAGTITTLALLGSTLGAAPTAAAASSDPHSDLAQNYTSLSASLIGFYAEKSNQSVSDYLGSQQLMLKPADLTFPTLGEDSGTLPEDTDTLTPDTDTPTGTEGAEDGETTEDGDELGDLDVAALSQSGGLLLTADQLGALSGEAVPVKASSIRALNRQLDASGVTLSSKKFKSLSDLARNVTRAARTPDGAVTLAAAQWATQLSQLRAPGLKTPGTPGASMPGVPADALPLGLLMNQSLTNMVMNHPNLIAQAQNKHGLGSKGLVQAWNSSMAQAYASSSGSLTSMLPNPCVGEMMGVMATGSKSKASGNCSNACVVAGQYLHYQAGAAFDPAQNSFGSNVNNPAGGILNHATFSNMASWAQGLVAAQNPTLTGGSSVSGPGNGPGDCASASQGTKNTLGSKLPGMFAGLR